MLVFFSICIFCSFASLISYLYSININGLVILCLKSVSLPCSEGRKYLFCSWVIIVELRCLLTIWTIFFSGQDNFKKQLFGRSIFLQLLWLQEEVQLKFHVKKKTYLTKKMYQILMRTLYEVSWAWVWHQLLLEQFLFHQFQEACKSGEGYTVLPL